MELNFEAQPGRFYYVYVGVDYKGDLFAVDISSALEDSHDEVAP